MDWFRYYGGDFIALKWCYVLNEEWRGLMWRSLECHMNVLVHEMAR